MTPSLSEGRNIMEQALLNFVSHHGNNSLYILTLVITLASMLKYVVPPLPGDLTILLSSFYLALHQASLLPIIVGITLGGMSGALIAYRLGSKNAGFLLSKKYFQSYNERAEEPFKKGAWFILLFNRFMPGLRPFIFPLAGIYKIDLKLVFFSAFAGNFIYGVFIYSISSLAGKHFEDVKILYGLLGFWLEFVILSLVAAGVLYFCKDKILKYRRKTE
jgi:membrane protein DedA with SNARE-associated domain